MLGKPLYLLAPWNAAGWSKLRRRLLLVLAAAVILLAVFLYPSLTACRLSRDQLEISPLSTFVVPVMEGYAVGFSFNLTNLGSCTLTAESIQVHISEAAFANGTVTAPNLSEGEQLLTTVGPGQSAEFSYAFDSYFIWKPLRIVLKVELTFTGVGAVTVFDGPVEVTS